MQLTFLGGADEVGASSTLVEIAGKRILVDAGIRISPRTSRGIQNDQLPDLRAITDAGGIDVILVTHAHTDHTGALPLVVEQYPHIPVIATRPTQVLTRILQADAQNIMRSRQEHEGELPIFDEVASQRLMDAFQTVEFYQPLKLGEGLQVTYHPSGHITGAAMLVFESEEGTLVMSGDVSLNNQRAVVSARIPNIKADALVLESTYGGRLHANRDAEEKRLIESLKAVADGGGKALIPAFALGRSQEILQIILAYRDVLDVPVYVDGMVRAVCVGYNTFADLLPKHTVKSAGEQDLFFRNKIYAVNSGAMRDQVLNSPEPCVIVSSSGMLTGGASVGYALALAPDPKNAIFLTGYQDEEAPGRRLQDLLRARQSADETGQTATLKIDNKSVTVRCHVDTYSLSAHADEMELISMADSFDPEVIMLVHGDHGARNSVASALRQRGRRALTPKIGQTQTFDFPKRPWALADVQKGNHLSSFNAQALWEAIKSQAGNFYSARELAQMWWGDSKRAKEIINQLQNNDYFAQDWRKRDQFQVRTPAQVKRVQRQKAIMGLYPDLVGSFVALRDTNDRLRFGVVMSADETSFEAEVANTKGRYYPADQLLWVFGQWRSYPEGVGIKGQINALTQKARLYSDQLLPFVRRQKLVADGVGVIPDDLLPAHLPAELSPLEALVAVVIALANDGAVLQGDGLLPKRAREGEPLEQNQAREVAFAIFPDEARLRKVGIDVHRRRLLLTVDFPDYVRRHYEDLLEALEDQTGWTPQLNTTVTQQALIEALNILLPPTAKITKKPSFYMDRREVGIGLRDVDDLDALLENYLDMTGYRLIVAGDSPPTVDEQALTLNTTTERLEINKAYSILNDALKPLGMYKAGLKQDVIVLSFISPQVAERHTDTLTQLAQEVGYPLQVSPNPNQQAILQVANQVLRDAGWGIRKGPGIHVDRGEVTVTVGMMPDEATLAHYQALFEEQTGYRLIVSG
jgi:Cft2 family RNA processing exonuclease